MKRYTEADVLAELKRRIETQGLRGFCRHAGFIDPGFVSQVSAGKKRLSRQLAAALGFEEMDRAFVKRNQPVSHEETTRGLEGVREMTEKQVLNLARKIAKQYAGKESIRRSDVIRDVVRTKKLNLEDSVILADCIVKGLLEAGKPITVSA